MKLIVKTGGLALLLLLLGACSTTAPATPQGHRPRLALTVTPDYLRDGEVGTPYTFTLRATGFRDGDETATFKWNFAGGSTGEQEVTVVDGAARLDITQSYAEAGVYALVAVVESAGRSATASAIVSIGGATPEREVVLASCGDWVSQKAGSYGVTIDRWDISAVPVGAVFDIKFDTFGIPDRILVVKPDGTLAHDTGWRGDARYDGDALYPGGVVGPKTGEVPSVFKKTGGNSFTIQVLGPDPRTLWNYEVRCRTGV